MKKAGIIIAALFVGFNAMAQVFDKDTLAYGGNSDKHINLVILGDGYRSSELSKFVTDATDVTTAFFNVIPYSNYKKFFNVFIVKVPSNESGASHPGTATDGPEPPNQPVIVVDNYFGSSFDFYGIHRLLVASKTTAIDAVLQSNYPAYDIVLILVNSPYYGGSGGYYTVASTDPKSVEELAAHELGHSFGGLNDEYWAGDNYAGEGVNMTKETNPDIVRWKNWIGVNLIGMYQHCCTPISLEWYRPHQNCKMRYLNTPFCSVCVQATVEKIHDFVTPLESYSPQNSSTINATAYPVKFKLNLIDPAPNTLKRYWVLNRSFFRQKIDSVMINAINLLSGTNTLRVTVEDTTQLLRVDNHSTIHISSVTWSINKSITGIKDISGSSSDIIIDLYPNPASELINIRLQGDSKGEIILELYDFQGRMVKAGPLQASEVTSVNLHDLSQGIYVAKFFMDNNLITTREIIKN
jgi:hypothetical protein